MYGDIEIRIQCVLILVTGSKGNRFLQATIQIGKYTFEDKHVHKFKRMHGFSVSGELCSLMPS